MLVLKRWAAVAAAILASSGAALAGMGQPSPWQLGLQQSVTEVMDYVTWFHNILLVIITRGVRV